MSDVTHNIYEAPFRNNSRIFLKMQCNHIQLTWYNTIIWGNQRINMTLSIQSVNIKHIIKLFKSSNIAVINECQKNVFFSVAEW